MQSFKKPSRRSAVVLGAAGLAVAGAVGFGTVAFADGMPTPGASQSAPAAAPSGAPSGAPVAPEGGPQGGPQGGPAGGPQGPAQGGPGRGPGRDHPAPHIGGTVQSVSGSTVTVQDPDGFTRTIRLSDDVKVEKDGASSSTSAIVKGKHIDATGTVASDGTTLDATAVQVGRPTPPAPGEGGPAPKDGAAPKAPAAPSAPSGSTEAPSAPSGAPSAPAAPAAPSAAPSASTGS
ncbi:single stranded DNA-binding domain-containing protein [Amnibacterium setariae]|uniref:DUF5666 domain-containing protein n=1 Tax=Amnibacterium setariae TaxID=2306585 RepID=A0A3A1U9D0_9MICO|nr:hypothetical protein [Amnibacterium setariae]RIX30859.1 hypothetical protein D1781_05555 [Amnibacterium setariae]